MSTKDENRGMINAYDKMLKDGTAFKDVDMTMNSNPNMAEAQGIGVQETSAPLGEVVNNGDDGDRDVVNDNDYSKFDSVMEQKMANLRNKAGMSSGRTNKTSNNEMEKLKRRVKKLEEALMLVIETQTKLIG